jgi:hypothetical protein
MQKQKKQQKVLKYLQTEQGVAARAVGDQRTK